MAKQGKVWGETEEIFRNGHVSVNYLQIKKGGYCSEHKHRMKSNLFFVLSGNLRVTSWMGGKMFEDEVVLGPGESTEILPGIYHKFTALTDVECIETYETALLDPDIERRTHGGIAK